MEEDYETSVAERESASANLSSDASRRCDLPCAVARPVRKQIMSVVHRTQEFTASTHPSISTVISSPPRAA